jgi:hypothetical protein
MIFLAGMLKFFGCLAHRPFSHPAHFTPGHFMLSTSRVVVPLVFLVAAAEAVSAWAAQGSVQLELTGASQGSALIFQEWGKALSNAGVQNVRFNSSSTLEQPTITTQGVKERPIYVVTGIIMSRDEILLPGGRYRRAELGKVVEWLNDLAANGPPDQRAKRLAFGLTAEQLQKVYSALAAPVGFSTRGMSSDQVVERIGRQLQPPLKIDADAGRALSNGTVSEELSGLACGTALAYALRPADYCLTLRDAGGSVAFSVAKVRAGLEAWPIGMPVEKAPEAVPALFETHNVNVKNAPVADAIRAIGGLLKMPVLLDQKAMTRHGIDPAKKMVSVPQGRMTYHAALRKLLFQAWLKYEVRRDEAGAFFLWITTLKPIDG